MNLFSVYLFVLWLLRSDLFLLFGSIHLLEENTNSQVADSGNPRSRRHFILSLKEKTKFVKNGS